MLAFFHSSARFVKASWCWSRTGRLGRLRLPVRRATGRHKPVRTLPFTLLRSPSWRWGKDESPSSDNLRQDRVHALRVQGHTPFVSPGPRPRRRRSGLALPAHPHMLRHACGFALADQGADTRLIQDYLGHRNIQHTVRYTATNPARFERLWR